MSSATTNTSTVVVFKNLPMESTVADLDELLKRLDIQHSSIDRKVDSSGEFRGTAFVRCQTHESAARLLHILKDSEVQLHGRKVKAELLRRAGSGKSLNAKSVLEGESMDKKAMRVRDLIAAFMHSNHHEMMLPADFDSEQRKLAHSMAEKFNLNHATVSGNGTSLNSATSDGTRSVLLTKNRSSKSSRNGSMRLPAPSAQPTRTMASMMAAAATNELAHIRPLLPHAAPEIPVFAAPLEEAHHVDHHGLESMDQVAMIHAAKAQMHAEAARHALQAAKASKEREAIPAWLEIVPQKHTTHKSMRSRAGSSLNANAPEFIPSASLMGPPPGLSPKSN